MPDPDVTALRAKYTQTQLTQMALDVERASVYLIVAHVLLSSFEGDLTALDALISEANGAVELLRAARDG